MERASLGLEGEVFLAQFLGPFQVRKGDEIRRPPSRQAARVAAILVLFQGSVVPREYLARQLWPEDPPDSAANAIQVHISKVRKLLAPFAIELQSEGYCLESLPTDGALVRESSTESMDLFLAGDFLSAAATAHAALEMWRGEPFDGLDGPEVREQRAFFAEVRAQLAQTHLEARIELATSPIQVNAVVAESAGFVARYPHRSKAHDLFRHALRKAGRFEEAAAHRGDVTPYAGHVPPLDWVTGRP